MLLQYLSKCLISLMLVPVPEFVPLPGREIHVRRLVEQFLPLVPQRVDLVQVEFLGPRGPDHRRNHGQRDEQYLPTASHGFLPFTVVRPRISRLVGLLSPTFVIAERKADPDA